MSTLERCGTTKDTNAQWLTLFSGEQATKVSSAPLSGALEGGNRDLYTKVWAELHNLIGGSQQHHQALTPED
jgi:hypothetical protein